MSAKRAGLRDSSHETEATPHTGVDRAGDNRRPCTPGGQDAGQLLTPWPSTRCGRSANRICRKATTRTRACFKERLGCCFGGTEMHTSPAIGRPRQCRRNSACLNNRTARGGLHAETHCPSTQTNPLRHDGLHCWIPGVGKAGTDEAAEKRHDDREPTTANYSLHVHGSIFLRAGHCPKSILLRQTSCAFFCPVFPDPFEPVL